MIYSLSYLQGTIDGFADYCEEEEQGIPHTTVMLVDNYAYGYSDGRSLAKYYLSLFIEL